VARTVALCLLIAAGIAVRAYYFINLPPVLNTCSTDFAAFYAGGRLAGTAQLYSPEAAFAVQQQTMGCWHPNEIFIKPPFYALLMWPLAQLPFLTALALWRILGLAAMAGFIWLWRGDRLAAVAACAWSLPLATNFTSGQDVTFVLLAAMGAYRLLKAGRQFWAGVLFGICGIKFHLLLLLPLFLFRRRLWRTVWGGAAMGAVLVAACFLEGGPGWLGEYRGALASPRMNPDPARMINLQGLLGYGSPWIWPATAVVVLLCGYLIWRGSTEVALAVVLAGGVLITPHNTVSDGVLLLPGLLMALEVPWPPVRLLAMWCLTPLYILLPPGGLQVMLVALLGMAVWLEAKREPAKLQPV